MPHLFSFASHASETEQQFQHEVAAEELAAGKRQRRLSEFKKSFGGIWKRRDQVPEDELTKSVPEQIPSAAAHLGPRRGSLPDINEQRRAIPSLPRPQTFRRQESERREKLLEVPYGPQERRAQSESRQRGLSASAARRSTSPTPFPSLPSVSAPNVACQDHQPKDDQPKDDAEKNGEGDMKTHRDLPPLHIPDVDDIEVTNDDDDEDGPETDQASLIEEYEDRWILNLSMRFRDKSNREKFFVTYAKAATNWRRLTVSLDYRNAPPGSLEEDLSTLVTQRDKSFRIYEAIRESLPEIQYYNTVTNLKLETAREDGQLHVHVREDANEIINYPTSDLFEHVDAPRFAECDLEFVSHLSGFVYKVRAAGKTVIKKEIPGPDTIDEFLYEVNALDALIGSSNVVQLEGLVTDDSGLVVKGLLISYASRGALVDMLYDFRSRPNEPTQLPWHRREKWALQVVRGLSDIHEAGFVQGDFTLSNIVIDEDDAAQIIDINRRGCPVGWEPPELGRLVDSGQRIGMCIGVKTDIFQLGMVLWALAEEVDEPERVERPLPPVVDTVPAYFRRIVETCLSYRPQARQSARRMLNQFPPTAGLPPPPGRPSVDFAENIWQNSNNGSLSTSHRSDKEYIDPDMAVTLEDVNARHRRRNTEVSHFTSGQVTYVDPRDPESRPDSTSYRFGSSGSWIVPRGRSGRRSSPFARRSICGSSVTSVSVSRSRSPPSRSRRRCLSESSGGVEVEREDEKADEKVEKPAAVEFHDFEHEKMKSEAEPDFLRNPRLAAVRTFDSVDRSLLLHTDSGFDEQMVEEIEVGPPARVCSTRSGSGCVQHENPPCSSPEEGVGWQSTAPETPGSFHTPMTSLEDPLAKIAVVTPVTNVLAEADDLPLPHHIKHDDSSKDEEATALDKTEDLGKSEQENTNMIMA